MFTRRNTIHARKRVTSHVLEKRETRGGVCVLASRVIDDGDRSVVADLPTDPFFCRTVSFFSNLSVTDRWGPTRGALKRKVE